ITVQARLVEGEGRGQGSGTGVRQLTPDPRPPVPAFIEISVEDSGIGISADDRELIFAPFMQVKGGLTDKTPGTGLGLALTKEFVALHGGQIRVESEGLEKGSRFYVLLPIEAPVCRNQG
ncbi:MAG: ATP-binding protein, partial [Smithellaceae bacterium]|nr:ATP-binding protein [Smithellaceae bacterium]